MQAQQLYLEIERYIFFFIKPFTYLLYSSLFFKHGSVQCAQWLLENTSSADEMSSNPGRLALIQLTIQSGQDECLKYLLSYISGKYLELGKMRFF